jgi:inner membrane protein
MPSPIGHALAGLAAAWAVDLVPGNRASRTAQASASWLDRAGNGLTVACVALAAAADLDLLVNTPRTVTHSLTAVVVVGALAAALAANARRPVARIASMCAVAYATHLFLDWLAVDVSPPRGIQALWPFSREWFISDIDLFRRTERRHLWTSATMAMNVTTILQELVILVPPVIALWLVRVKALTRLPSEMARRDHTAE